MWGSIPAWEERGSQDICLVVRSEALRAMETHMSHSLNSLKGGYIRDYIGTTIGVIKGDTRSLDYSSHRTAKDGKISRSVQRNTM